MSEILNIERELIVGYAFTKSTTKEGITKYHTIPLVGGSDGVHNLINQNDETSEEIICTLPSNSLSYRVKGRVEGHDFPIFLGYEFEGASNPDWKKLLLSEYLKLQRQTK